MQPLSSKIRSISIEYGADLVGFAPVERFKTGPRETRPEHYLPSARSVVSIAIAYPQSISKVWGTFKEEGTLPGAYMWYGFSYLNHELSHIALKVAKILESEGYTSLPIPPSHTLVQYRFYEKFDEWGRYLGDFSHKHAALAAGLGAFGWSNLFLTEKYGARQRLISIITEAPFEYGELIDSTNVCRPDKCDFACVNTCPIGALSQTKAQTFTMDDKTYRYGQLDHFKCRWCLDGFTEGSGSRTHFEPPKQFEQADFTRAAAKREIPDKGLFLMGFIDFCGKCMHQCPSPDYQHKPKPIERFQDRSGCRIVS